MTASMHTLNRNTPPAIFLMGPTCAGKTRIAIELARRLPCEIISVDSTQVYKGLNIGSGKPDAATLKQFPHRLVNIRDPSEPYSAAQFRADALAAMAEISASGMIPLLVGGTMLYFKVLQDGLARMPKADPEVRARITALARAEGWGAVHRRLQAVDPESAARLKPADSQRLQRALEVFELSGRPISEFHARDKPGELPYRLHQLAVCPSERKQLHRHIETRFHRMLEQGLVDEVRALKARGDLDPTLPAIRSVGYRQVWEYLEGRCDYDTMTARALAATRQLAKRQLTWLKSWPDLRALDAGDPQIVSNCLNSLKKANIP